jgi:iron complex outermembrane receptor protein
LKFDPTDSLSFLLRYQHSASNDPTNLLGGTYVANGRELTIGTFIPGTIIATAPDDISNSRGVAFSNKSNVLQLTSTLTLPFATMTSYTQGRWETSETFINQDYSSVSFFALSIPIYNRTLTQEFLLASTGDSRLQWTTGLFFFDNSDQWEDIRLSILGAPLSEFTNSGSDTRSSAAFADLTYEAFHNFFVTGGARYSHDEVLDPFFINYPAGSPIRTDVPPIKTNTVTPRVVLRYKPDEASSVYASFSKGYKAPIVNVGGGSLVGINVAAETIKAYEVGYKYSRGPFSADVAAYHYDYTNLQVASYIGTASLINNAATARINGGEFDVRYKVLKALELNAGANIMDAKYGNYPDAGYYSQCINPAICGAGTGIFAVESVDASGNQMQRAPKFTGNIGARFTADVANGEFALAGNLYHTSTVYFTAANQFKQDPYSLLNLRAEWTDPSKHYTFALYGDNVTNARYLTQVPLGNFAIGAVWNYPVTYGVSVRVHF